MRTGTLMSLLVLFAGCGEETTAPAPAQAGSPPAAAAEPAPAAAPAADNPLVGTWNLDSTRMEAATQSASEDERMGLRMMMAMQPSFTFAADGALTGTFANPFSQTGERTTESMRYEIVGREGNTLTLRVTKGDEVKTNTVTLTDATHIEMKEGDDPVAVHLVRS